MAVRNFLKIINRAAFYSYRSVILNKNSFIVPQGGQFRSTIAEASEITSVTNNNSLKQIYSRQFREFFLKNPNYANLIFESKISITETSSKSLRILKQFYDGPDSDNVLKKLPDIMKEELVCLTYDELLEVINLVFKCCGKKLETDICLQLMKDLDFELMNRFKSYEKYNDVLKVLDLISHSLYVKQFKFFYCAMFKLLRKISTLTNEQAVYLMYLIIPCNNAINKEYKFKIDKKIFSVLTDLSFKEIGTFYYGCAKLKLKLTHPKIFPVTLEKIINDVEHLDSSTLQAVCNCISVVPKSFQLKQVIADFQEKMIPHVSKFNPISLVYLLLTNVSNNKLNMTLAGKVIEKVKEDINLCNKKALERLLYLFVQFNIEDKELVTLVIEILESMVKTGDKRDDLYSTLVRILNHLIHLQVYPDHLLKFTMTVDFINHLFSRKYTTAIVQWSFINNCLKLDNPQYYCGGLTAVKQKKIFFMKIYKHFRPRERLSFYTTNFTLEECLKKNYGEEKVFWNSPLLHYPGVVWMIFDRNFEAQTIPEEFKRDKHFFETRKPPDDDNFWICFLSLSSESYTDDCKEINFVIQTKIRHFSKVGFKPLLVETKYLKELKEKKTEDTFLKDLINNKIVELMEQEKLQLST